jgi:hypothetical protein
MAIEHQQELPHPTAKIHGTRSSPRADGEHVVSIDTDALGVVGIDSDTEERLRTAHQAAVTAPAIIRLVGDLPGRSPPT